MNVKVSELMTEKGYIVPQYDDVDIAARVMRNHKIYRVVAAHEKKGCRHAERLRSAQARRRAAVRRQEWADPIRAQRLEAGVI